MRNARFLMGVILIIALSLPAWAQNDRRGPAGDAGAARGGLSAASAPSAPSNTMSSRGVAVGDYSSANTMTAARDMGPSYSSAISSRTASVSAVPNLSGTSFYTADTYFAYQDFLWRLRSLYMLDSMYFRRFYRNTEPLITPALMRLTLRNPLRLSAQMMQSVAELESMVSDLEAGKPVNKQEIASKANEIRDLAKKIRADQNLNFIDRRLDTDVSKGNRYDNLGLGAIHQLREMATDLNSQLKNMYNQSTTSTVSVSSLTQPSFESLSKGIEKLTKVIESSAKRI